MRESNIQKEIMMAVSEAGCLIWRQNVGVAYVGDQPRGSGFLGAIRSVVLRFFGSVRFILLINYRRLTAGLCVGSSDLIGICPDGKFLAIEVKTPTGRVSADQKRYIEAVKKQGGRAGVARSVADALRIIFED